MLVLAAGRSEGILRIYPTPTKYVYIVGRVPASVKPHSLPQTKGQGALEYLLLIWGAVLIATVVLLVVIGSAGTGNTIVNDNIDTAKPKSIPHSREQ